MHKNFHQAIFLLESYPKEIIKDVDNIWARMMFIIL